MTSGKTRSRCSMSARLDSRPREKRNRELASAAATPRASITCDGSTEPAEHADPPEAQMPSKSRLAKREILSQPRTVHEMVLIRQFVAGERRTHPRGASWSNKRRRRVFSGWSREGEKTGVLTNFSKAAVRPTIAATFSVPARRSFSWLPPNRIGSGCRGDRTNKAPAPFGPWNLWAQIETKSALNW